MKICWDILENVKLSKTGNFYKFTEKYRKILYYFDHCEVCQEPFLSITKNPKHYYCSQECYKNSEYYKVAIKITGTNTKPTNVLLKRHEIIELKNKHSRQWQLYLTNRYPITLKKINEFCDGLSITCLSQKTYHYVNKLKEIPICSECNNNATFNILNTKWGYNKYCSISCSGKSKDRIDKIITTKTKSGYFDNVHEVNSNKVNKILNSDIEILSIDEVYKRGLVLTQKNDFDIPTIKMYLIKHDPALLKSIYHHFKDMPHPEVFYLMKTQQKHPPLCMMCNKKAKFYTCFVIMIVIGHTIKDLIDMTYYLKLLKTKTFK